jgi:hypothetical protein
VKSLLELKPLASITTSKRGMRRYPVGEYQMLMMDHGCKLIEFVAAKEIRKVLIRDKMHTPIGSRKLVRFGR